MATFDTRTYWEDRLARRYSLDGVGYLGLGEAFNTWMYRVRRHIFLQVARRLVHQPAAVRVLDIGSGTGFYIDAWHELGVTHLTGSDLTHVAVERLRDRYPAHVFVEFDVAATHPFGSARFPVISLMDVLFHIVDDDSYEQAMRNIFDLLEPGGLVIFTENFLGQGTVRLPHQASRTLSSIQGTIGRVGLEIVLRRPVFYLMNAPVDSANPLHKMWWETLQRLVSRSNAAGNTLGALLYPVELALVSLFSEGPSTELMVCRRPATPT